MKEKFLSLVGFSLQRDNFRTEIISGITTFFTMVYILALLPAMFAPLGEKGFPVESMFTATALSAVVGTLIMAFVAKRPFGLASDLHQDLLLMCFSSRLYASRWAILGSLHSQRY